jgi:hypothetical protein
MSAKLIGVGCVILSLVAVASSPLYAQRPLRRYQPPGGPTLSPYENYNSPNFGTVPSVYQSYILPQRQLQRNLYDLSRSQQADFRKLENQLMQFKNSTAAPTGVGGSFMNYSHYYQLPQGGAR